MKLRHLFSRAVLRPLRTLPAARIPFDPHSPEYLYVAQQAKRLSLVRTLDSFRLGNLPLWPVLSVIALAKWVDLMISNALVRSLINEYDLLQRISRETENPP
jgi:hypothetical protein